jgi:hypothetical protein
MIDGLDDDEMEGARVLPRQFAWSSVQHEANLVTIAIAR